MRETQDSGNRGINWDRVFRAVRDELDKLSRRVRRLEDSTDKIGLIKYPPVMMYWSDNGAIKFKAHESMTLVAETQDGTGTITFTLNGASDTSPFVMVANDVLVATLTGATDPVSTCITLKRTL